MYSDGLPHMAGQKQDDQLEHTFSNYVRIWDVALKTCKRRWTTERSGERRSGISVLAARHDDDDYLKGLKLSVSLRERQKQWMLTQTGGELLYWLFLSHIQDVVSSLPWCEGLNQVLPEGHLASSLSGYLMATFQTSWLPERLTRTEGGYLGIYNFLMFKHSVS